VHEWVEMQNPCNGPAKAGFIANTAFKPLPITGLLTEINANSQDLPAAQWQLEKAESPKKTHPDSACRKLTKQITIIVAEAKGDTLATAAELKLFTTVTTK
jgi:hypothetical protein